MTEETMENQENGGNALVEFLITTVKYRWFLFWFVFVITVGFIIYAFVAPKWYKSVASVLPAEQNDMLSSLAGISSLAKGVSAGKGLAALAGKTSETDRYMAILNSGTITDAVIKKFDLRREYDLEGTYYEKVVKEWQSNVEMDVQDEGNLTICVYDKDPQKAADIVNYMIEKLNEINTALGVTNAKANREFVEKRYLQNVNDIDKLETDMKIFQQKHGVVAVPQQVEATVKSMSSLYVDLYKREVEYNVLKKNYDINHPLLSRAKTELDELRKKIDQINAGTDESQKDVRIIIPFKMAPELGNEYLKIYQNLQIQYKILEFIQPLYEQARIEEVRNTPSVLVLDKPGPADRKSRPKVTIYAVVSFLGSLCCGYLIVFFMVIFDKFKQTANSEYEYIAETLREDLRRLHLRKSR